MKRIYKKYESFFDNILAFFAAMIAIGFLMYIIFFLWNRMENVESYLLKKKANHANEICIHLGSSLEDVKIISKKSCSLFSNRTKSKYQYKCENTEYMELEELELKGIVQDVKEQ